MLTRQRLYFFGGKGDVSDVQVSERYTLQYYLLVSNVSKV